MLPGNLHLIFSNQSIHQSVKSLAGRKLSTAVTPEAVGKLAEFLQATGGIACTASGWARIHARAAEEAVFVAEKVGENLQCFQNGNEADLFDRHVRDQWSFIKSPPHVTTLSEYGNGGG